MSSELLIQCPDGQMKTIPLTGERLAVGRSSAAELCFPEDAGLSRQHFAFESQDGEWTVQDLGSKNGTFVNNIPLKARLILKPGDRITAGHLVVVYSPDAANPNSGRGGIRRRRDEFAEHLYGRDEPGRRALQPDDGVRARRAQGVGADAGADPRRAGVRGKPLARTSCFRSCSTWRSRRSMRSAACC